MNRLLIGDVGFGKTEVILRATYKMVEAGDKLLSWLLQLYWLLNTMRFFKIDLRILT
jgi:KaiC/GvpD/RAD55 family RecA-like ATPase